MNTLEARQPRRLAFLFGSGVSLTDGFPRTDEITEAVERHLRAEHMDDEAILLESLRWHLTREEGLQGSPWHHYLALRRCGGLGMGPLWAKSARSPKTATNGLTKGGRGLQVMSLAGSKPSPTVYILLAPQLLPNLGTPLPAAGR